ncbi:hypothetical protein AALA24_13635 [Anaerovoracaceae bacterium 42-11]
MNKLLRKVRKNLFGLVLEVCTAWVILMALDSTLGWVFEGLAR